MEFIPAAGSEPVSFKGKNLVLPAVSFGNVGQMAVDLIISTHSKQHPENPARKVGQLLSPDVLPVVGNDPFFAPPPVGVMSCNLEVYELPGSNTCLLQIRAPAVKGHEENLADGIAAWAEAAGFARILVAAGADAATRDDKQLEGIQLRWLSSEVEETSPGSFTQAAVGMAWPRLERAAPDLLARTPLREMQDGMPIEPKPTKTDPSLPEEIVRHTKEQFTLVEGTGYAPRIYRRSVVRGVPVMVLLLFVHEGDNIRDAVALASAVEGLCGACFSPTTATSGAGGGVGGGGGIGSGVSEAAPMSWVPPASWLLAFGPPRDTSIYG